MARKSRSNRGSFRPVDSESKASGAEPSLSRAVELRLRQEFEDLIQRMQSPQSAAAYDTVLNMTGAEVRDFFDGARKRAEGLDSSRAAASKQPAKFTPLACAEQLSYPCIVLAILNCFETGLGHVIGAMVLSVGSAQELREEVRREWTDYYAQSVEVRTWNDLSDEGALLPVEPVRRILARRGIRPSVLRYVSRLHVSYS